MDYLQQYASLRHREDRKLDAMATILTHCFALGWTDPPFWQTLYIVSWQGVGKSNGTVKLENGVAEFSHANVEGEEVYRASVSAHDHDKLTREATNLIDHLRGITSGTETAR